MKKLIFIVAILLCSIPTIQAAEIEFKKDLSWTEVKKLSQKLKKPVMIDMYTSWCGYCKKMDKTTFRDSSVAAYANKNFIPYKVDAEKGEGPSIARTYGVRGYPTIVYVDYNGQTLGVKPGYKSVPVFIQEMKLMKSDSKSGKLNRKKGEEHHEEPLNLESYIMLKKDFQYAILKDIEYNKAAKIKKYEAKALEYGGSANYFDYGELKHQAKKEFGEAIIARLNIKFYKGLNKQDKYVEAMRSFVINKENDKLEVHFYVLELIKLELIDQNTLIAINRICLDEKTYQNYDTKAIIHLLRDEKNDAKDAANKAKSIAKEKHLGTETSDWILEQIKKK